MRKFFPRYNLLIAENAVNQHTLIMLKLIKCVLKNGIRKLRTTEQIGVLLRLQDGVQKINMHGMNALIEKQLT